MKRWIFILCIISTAIACQTEQEMQPTVIIGGGLMGSATAWHLVQQGESVILLEQQDSIYTSGSSLGEARISRSLGPADDIYAYLQIKGIEETEKLIDFLNAKEPQAHSMEDVYTTSPVTYIFYPESSKEIDVFNLDQPDTLVGASSDSIALALDAQTAKTKFDLKISDSLQVIREFRKYSGTMNPNALIEKLHLAIGYSGGEVRYNHAVSSIKRTDHGYEIIALDNKNKTNKTIQAAKLIAAAGPYNGKLLKGISPAVDQLITPKRLFLAFIKIKPAVYQQLNKAQKLKLIEGYPVIKLHSELFYSMIETYDEDGVPLLKVGGHFKRTPITNLDNVWTQPLSDSEIEWSIDQTIDYLEMNELGIGKEDLEYQNGYSCVYSLTKSEVPLVTNLPLVDGTLDSNGVLIGGMSGVGAKGTMTYGHMAANLLLGREGNDARLYQITKQALGNQRLMKDIAELPESD